MDEDFSVDRDWAEIPYFRKTCFMVVLFLAFAAVTVMITVGARAHGLDITTLLRGDL